MTALPTDRYEYTVSPTQLLELQEAEQRAFWQHQAPDGTLPARALAGQDLQPGERILVVTTCGIPVGGAS